MSIKETAIYRTSPLIRNSIARSGRRQLFTTCHHNGSNPSSTVFLVASKQTGKTPVCKTGRPLSTFSDRFATVSNPPRSDTLRNSPHRQQISKDDATTPPGTLHVEYDRTVRSPRVQILAVRHVNAPPETGG